MVLTYIQVNTGLKPELKKSRDKNKECEKSFNLDTPTLQVTIKVHNLHAFSVYYDLMRPLETFFTAAFRILLSKVINM